MNKISCLGLIMIFFSIVIFSGCNVTKDSQISDDSETESRCYVSTFSELINESELILIGNFVDSQNFEDGSSNKYKIFEDLKIINGNYNNTEVGIKDFGGTFNHDFKKEKSYILFVREYDSDGNYDFGCIPNVEDYEIKLDDEGNEIIGCIRGFDNCIREEIPCLDLNNDADPIVKDSEGNVINQPTQTEKKCYSKGYSLLEDVINQIE